MILVSIAVIFWTAASAQEIDESCFHCHPAQVNEYRASVHFNKNTCADCHGETSYQRNRSFHKCDAYEFYRETFTYPVTDFCSKCHAGSTSVYKESIHWQKLNEGRPAATCTDCHGTHNILASNNPTLQHFRQMYRNMRKLP